MAMIPCVAWVRKGVAKAIPDKYEPEEAELAQISKETEDVANLQAQLPPDEAEDEKQNDENIKANAQVIKEFNLDKYDEEEDALESAAKGLSFYRDPEEDPDIVKEQDEYDMEELEDLTIRPTDLLILAAVNDEDYNHLDIYVYEEDHDNLYIHHDIILPEMPIAVTWLDFNARRGADARGNLCAVSSFLPSIDIYNLDVVDHLEPVLSLGGYDESASSAPSIVRKKKSAQKAQLKTGSHSQAVISMNWNIHHRHVLASASADKTVKAWDLNTAQCVGTFTHHQDKVQTVRWHPTEGSVLLTGCADGSMCALDARTPNVVRSWHLGSAGGVESLEWNPHAPQYFYATAENGELRCYDALKEGEPVLRAQVHSKECLVTINPTIPNYAATAGADKRIKLWDLSEMKCLYEKERRSAGHLFTASFASDSPFLLVSAGEEKQPAIFNTASVPSVLKKFAPNHPPVAPRADDEENDGKPLK